LEPDEYHRKVIRHPLALRGLLLVAACGAGLTAQGLAPGGGPLRFVDAAVESGLTLLNVHGGPAKDYIEHRIGASGKPRAFRRRRAADSLASVTRSQ
jgi:hypothetical protein